MFDKIQEIRNKYRPKEITLLFIGESPPSGGTFFYNGNSILFQYTREAFENFYNRTFQSYGAFLDFLNPRVSF